MALFELMRLGYPPALGYGQDASLFFRTSQTRKGLLIVAWSPALPFGRHFNALLHLVLESHEVPIGRSRIQMGRHLVGGDQEQMAPRLGDVIGMEGCYSKANQSPGLVDPPRGAYPG